MEINSESRWVAERLARTEVAWSPRLGRGLALLEERRRPSKSMAGWLAVAATAGVLLLVAALPASRVMAQELWYRVMMHRISMVQIDLSQLALDSSMSMNGNLVAVSNAQEAEAKAGFRPLLPEMGGPAQLHVISPAVMRQTIRVKPLEAALQRAGATDVAVPQEWEGIAVSAEFGATVMASYPGEVQLLQLLPIALKMPNGFPLARFVETMMRSVGMGWWDARLFADKFARNPELLIAVDRDEKVKLSEIPLPGGAAVLFEDQDEHEKAERFTIVLGTPGRLYVVTAPTREAGLQLAKQLR